MSPKLGMLDIRVTVLQAEHVIGSPDGPGGGVDVGVKPPWKGARCSVASFPCT